MVSDNPWIQIFAPFYEAIPWLIGLALAIGAAALGWDEVKRRVGRRGW